MSRETIIDSEYASLWYYPDKKIIHHKIHKFFYGDSIHHFMLAGTDLVKKHHACKWLSDDRDSPVLRKEDMEWGAANFFPQTIQAGWKYWAIVMPRKALGQMNMQQMGEMYAKMGLTVQFFSTLEEAMAWLEIQTE